MAAASLSSVRALGLQSTAEGGAVNQSQATEVNTLSDALAAAGLYVDGPSVTTADKTVLIDRASGGNLRLTDQATGRLLSELMTSVTGAVNAHDASRDAQHFLAGEGPGTGFASGAYCARSYNGALLLQEIWYASNAMTTRIVSRSLAYATGSPLPSTITWVIYSASNVALHTIVDSMTYSGPLLQSVTRTWS